MVLAKLGEVGIHTSKGRTFILRPSLYAISQLGESREIVETFKKVMEGDLFCSLEVLEACGSQEFLEVSEEIFGYFTFEKEGWNFIEGIEPPEVAILLAQHLLIHGVAGNVKPPSYELPKEDDNYTSEFKPEEIASLAMAHLGYNERESWNMTLTAILLALKAKYPNYKPATEKMEEAINNDKTMADILKSYKNKTKEA